MDFKLNQTHHENCRQGLQALLDSGTLSASKARKVKNVLKSDKRLEATSYQVANLMYHKRLSEGFSAGDFGAFIDTVQNWIDFIIANQDKITKIINFIMTVVVPLFG